METTSLRARLFEEFLTREVARVKDARALLYWHDQSAHESQKLRSAGDVAGARYVEAAAQRLLAAKHTELVRERQQVESATTTEWGKTTVREASRAAREALDKTTVGRLDEIRAGLKKLTGV